MFLTLLIGFGCLNNVYGGDSECKSVKPLENYPITKFLGDWFIAAMEGSDETITSIFGKFNCRAMKLYDSEQPESKQYTWSIDIPAGEVEIDTSGTYYIKNPNVGFMILYFPSLNLTLDYYVLCTDYNSWALTYGCPEIIPGHKSELFSLYVKDISKINEVLNKEEVKHCYKGVNQMFRFRQHQCPAYTQSKP